MFICELFEATNYIHEKKKNNNYRNCFGLIIARKLCYTYFFVKDTEIIIFLYSILKLDKGIRK